MEFEAIIKALSDDDLFILLKQEGLDPGPIFSTVRKFYEKKLHNHWKDSIQLNEKKDVILQLWKKNLEHGKINHRHITNELDKSNLIKKKIFFLVCLLFFFFIYLYKNLNIDKDYVN